MKPKSQHFKPILTSMAVTFIVVFFILTTQTTAKAAQPNVAAGWYHTVGLKYNGKVVAVGDNTYGQLNVTSWTDIVQVAAGGDHTVGLKSDGSVVAVGRCYHGQCNVFDWNLILLRAMPWIPLLLLED